MNITTRLFVTFALLIALAVGSAIGITHWLGGNAVNKQVALAFSSSQSLQRYFLEQQLRELELTSELIATDRAFVAYIAQSLYVSSDQPVDVRSITDLLSERGTEYNFDLSLILSPDGIVQAQTGNVITLGNDLSSRTVIADAISSLSAGSGLWVTREQVLQIAIAPLVSGRTIQGFLVTGNRISSELMSTMADIAGTQLAYVSLTDASPRIVESTLSIADQDKLDALLKTNPGLVTVTPANQDITPNNVNLNQQAWITQATAIENNPDSLLISLVPQARLYQTFSNISNILLIAALASILLALLVSVSAARRILAPLEALTQVAEDATRGEFRQHIAIQGSGEVVRLQRAFNRLVSDLREQQAAEAYFEELWQKQGADERLARSSNEPSESENDLELLPFGTLLGNRYEILKVTGQGGMGVVYEAIDKDLHEVVALKTLKPSLANDSNKVERLKQEIRLARRITHPNIVRTFDFARIHNVPLISMEFVRGITLEEAIRRYGRVNFHACMRLALQICSGVAAAHKAGVLHRDIKPGNVMVTHLAKVMDFGIAHHSLSSNRKQLEADSLAEQTFAGSPTYLSPEQLRGEQVDERSDIYSLGILFTEMFTGKVPHASTSTREIFKSHLQAKLVLPSIIWPEIPIQLEAILLQCMELKRSDRWQSVDQIYSALDEFRLNS